MRWCLKAYLTVTPFVVVITQSEKQQTFSEFKAALRSFEETENARSEADSDSVMKGTNFPDTRPRLKQDGKEPNDFKCFRCSKQGHIARNCRTKPDSSSNRWCSTCRNSTHNDSNCRRKNRARKDKISQVADNHDEERTFSFKVSESRDIPVDVCSMLLLDCGATSHIITDKSKFITFDESFQPEIHFVELVDGSRSNRISLKRGDANVRIIYADGRCVIAKLENALYFPRSHRTFF